MEKDIKAIFDEFYSEVGDLCIRLIQDEYAASEEYMEDYNFVKNKLITFNDEVTQEDMKSLCEEHVQSFIDWMMVSTTISSISNCLDHVLFKNTVVKTTENSTSKAKTLH
ncbi:MULTISPECIES: hypothetical protein [Pantoea]|uniref:hypothetical protein n=1 Tax=Pantoea TaxID=53335 RepID=UPI002B1DFB56|nr:hypothetical protein [Pantoea ananatis]